MSIWFVLAMMMMAAIFAILWPLSHSRGDAVNRRLAALLAFMLIPALSFGLYIKLGSPSLPDQPHAERKTMPDINAMIARIERRLVEHPEDGKGWEVIAPVYQRLGRREEAVRARQQALKLLGQTAERETALGEAIMMQREGMISAEAKAAFERAVALDQNAMKARYFLGLAAKQENNPDKAIQSWREILKDSAPDAPWREWVENAIKETEE